MLEDAGTQCSYRIWHCVMGFCINWMKFWICDFYHIVFHGFPTILYHFFHLFSCSYVVRFTHFKGWCSWTHLYVYILIINLCLLFFIKCSLICINVCFDLITLCLMLWFELSLKNIFELKNGEHLMSFVSRDGARLVSRLEAQISELQALIYNDWVEAKLLVALLSRCDADNEGATRGWGCRGWRKGEKKWVSCG